ncbi:TRPL translocation defect protein 14-like [Stylophora pistillata]|uniref:NadR/Ttd14 AAA domain-containing protein n=1 Tax=Stylophora pistillata TaxID=50429 RepID=A0A2B4SAM9_STYPI|nr:TRPL translocation defect protein 14-like [Stylophora pistillata]PFX25628.1 hypothetical protein AWC38_SpisGene9719 [Stylophora pistillata]
MNPATQNGSHVNDLDGDKKERRVYKVALTGGPCAGKTTVQAMMSTFFENLGWKVYRVPEAATILLGGGVKFPDLSEQEVYNFQENLMRTLLQLEQTFFDLASTSKKDTIVICDRGAMDPSSYMSSEQWDKLLENNGWNNVSLRDARYDQVIHLVSAAQGAEDFYTLANNNTRKEPIEQARKLDRLTQQAWVGHPYVDVIENNIDFSKKVRRAIDAVCFRMRIDTGDRLSPESVKRKFLVTSLPDVKAFPVFQDFDVVHNYLSTSNPERQARLRRRGQNGHFTYMHTLRLETKVSSQIVEVRTNLSARDYEILFSQVDHTRQSVYKTRRCFLWGNQYFQLDIYNEPCHPRCKGLLILETYTTIKQGDLELPDFLDIAKEVTGDPSYSMFHLALKE